MTIDTVVTVETIVTGETVVTAVMVVTCETVMTGETVVMEHQQIKQSPLNHWISRRATIHSYICAAWIYIRTYVYLFTIVAMKTVKKCNQISQNL